MSNKVSVFPKNHTIGVTANPISMQIDLDHEDAEYFNATNKFTTTIIFNPNPTNEDDDSKVIVSSIEKIRSTYIECTITFSENPQETYDVIVTQTEKNNPKPTKIVWNGDDVFVVD